MRIKKYVSKAGKEGQSYHLESGDEFEPMFDTPHNVTGLNFPKAILGVKINGEEVTLTLTPTQTKQLEEIGELKGRTIICDGYESHGRKCVGCKEKKGTTKKLVLSTVKPEHILTVKLWLEEEGAEIDTIVANLKSQLGVSTEEAMKVIEKAKE